MCFVARVFVCCNCCACFYPSDQIIESDQSTKFLRNILTTTPSTSHISHFRNQPRTDSRADKPDTFPGFDFQDDEATQSPIHRRRQAYSHLLRSFLRKTRERLETIREVAKQERAMARTKSQQQQAADTASPTPNANLIADDEDDDDEALEQSLLMVMTDPADRSSVPRQYYATLLSSVGLQRTMPSANRQSERLQSEAEPSFVTTYISDPLLNVWQRARDNFNLSYYYRNNGDATANSDADDDDADDDDEDSNGPIRTAMAATLNANENNDKEIAFNSVADNGLNGNGVPPANASVSLIVVGSANNANHSLLSKLNANSARSAMLAKENIEEIGSDGDGIGATSQWERATLAFRNAFYKYAGVMSSQQTDDNDDDNVGDNDTVAAADDDGSQLTTTAATNEDTTVVDMTLAQAIPLTDIRSVEEDVAVSPALSSSNELAGNNGEAKLNGITTTTTNTTGNVVLAATKSRFSTTSTSSTTESANIQIIPSHLMMQQQQQQQSGLHPAESAGIFVLEIVGSVVGLAWGTVSQIHSWFNKN